MPYAAREGTRLFYREAGTGDPAFVFVHGWTCNHSYFAPQYEYFADRSRVVAVDLRGHGSSDAPNQRYTVEGFADDVAWLCSEIAISGAVLVGHSMGGTVVLDLAARYPDLVAAVVMVDSAPIVASPELAEVHQSVGVALLGPQSAAARTAIAENLAAAVHDNAELQARIIADMSSTAHHVAVSCIANLGTWDGEGAARACRVPTLHIGAENPINDAGALRALNPLFRTAQTAGAGHFNQLEVPEQVNAMIDRFLAVSLR